MHCENIFDISTLISVTVINANFIRITQYRMSFALEDQQEKEWTLRYCIHMTISAA